MDFNKTSQDILANLSEEERLATIKILKDLSEKGKSKTLDKLYYADFEEVPVDIDTFIESDEYIGWFTNNGKDIYPYWREQLRNIFNKGKSYSEIALTGSIGIGKSTIAVIGLAYCLYRLMCLKDPHDYYHIGKGGYIYIVFFNLTLQLSQGVAYTKFQSLLQNSPWFMRHGQITGKKYLEYIPDGPIRFTVGSQVEHSLGKDIFAGMMDEIDFSKGADPVMEKSKIMKTYNNVLERMGSRFMVNGKIAGSLFLVSSKKSEQDFLESYIQRKKNDPTVYVSDAPLWEVKPAGTYSGQTFRVAVGNSVMPSRIADDTETDEELEKKGYTIIRPPVEFKERFRMDINAALMNIAGISVSYTTKFIPYTILSQCYNVNNVNPFGKDILEIGLHDNYSIRDFFIPELVSSQVYSRKLFIHIDASLTGDKTGIGCTAVMGFRDQDRYDDKSGDTIRLKEFIYKHVFSVDIKAPKGDEISFQKIREFIYYLRHIGWNIAGVSLDGFQSADCRQQLETAGFIATIVSLDRTPNGYLAFRSALAEKRVSMIKIPFLETEIIRLERNNMTGKVDHPVDGSKDMSDGLAGSIYNASISVKPEDMYNMEDYSVIMDVNPVNNLDVSDNPANEMFDFVPKQDNTEMSTIEVNPSEIDQMDKQINQQNDVVKELRSKLSKSENRDVSDEELLSALYNRDDNIIIF